MPEPKNYLIDMDGVLLKGSTPIPGAAEFIERLQQRNARYLVLTNNPIYTPGDLAHRLNLIGLPVSQDHIYTSAMAMAQFLHAQRPDGTAYVIGESGLTEAIHNVGYVITDHDPDYVVLGETHAYNLTEVTKAVRLVAAGARFVATNPDPIGPAEGGIVPACGAMVALVEKATGKQALITGKPNPLMMRNALNHLGVHSENTVMVGDNMLTDIVAGVESGLETILVLSGVTQRQEIDLYAYQPTHIVQSVADIQP